MKYLRLLLLAIFVLAIVTACAGNPTPAATEEPTEAVIEATEVAVEPTEAEETETAVEETEAAMEATEAELEETEAAMEATEAEVEETEAAVEPTEAVMEGTEEAAILPIGAWDTCATPSSLPETVNLGAVLALSDAAAVYGLPQRQAIELAVSEINASGYLGEGVTLTVTFEDGPTPEGAVAAMTKLVVEDGVVAVLGPTLSGHAFAADPVAQENGTVVLGVSNTANGITEMGDFVFRNSLPESAVIPGTIAGAVETYGITKVAVLYGDDNDFTISGYNVFIEALDANGVEVLGEETFAGGDVDFSAQLTNLIALNPDAIVVSALAPEGIQIITQARTLGYTGRIIGGNGFNSPAVITGAGDDSEGLVVGAAWNIASPNALSVQFIENYQAEYESLPDQFAVQAYTGAWLLATAIRCADSVDRTAVRDSLAGIQDFDSPLGLFSFDENRNPVHEPVVQVVEDGVFAVLGSE
jgi:branched-chain amino acid transport system substrate-binding protein